MALGESTDGGQAGRRDFGGDAMRGAPGGEQQERQQAVVRPDVGDAGPRGHEPGDGKEPLPDTTQRDLDHEGKGTSSPMHGLAPQSAFDLLQRRTEAL